MSRFSKFVDALDHVFKLRDCDSIVENTLMLNKVLFGGAKLLGSHDASVCTLASLVQVGQLTHLSIESLLWRLPSLLNGATTEEEKALYDRMQRLSLRDVPVLHEQQRGQLCLMHALNNLLECRVFSNKNNESGDNIQMVNLHALDKTSTDSTSGNYMDETIPRACEHLKLLSFLLPASCHSALSTISRAYGATIGAIALRRNHYVAIRMSYEQPLLADSLDARPKVFSSSSSLENYLSRCSMLWVVIAKPNHKLYCCGPRLRNRLMNSKYGNLEIVESFMKQLWESPTQQRCTSGCLTIQGHVR
jgi:hypothetical protein